LVLEFCIFTGSHCLLFRKIIEKMSDLVTLMTIDIPEGRNSLLESQTNLEKVTIEANI
jgi:hypothetical protein